MNLQLYYFQRCFLGHDLLDEGLESGVCFQELLAQASLHGGLDLGAVARRNTVSQCVSK